MVALLAMRPSPPAIGASSSCCFSASHRAPTSSAVKSQIASLSHHAAQLLNAPSNPTSCVSNCLLDGVAVGLVRRVEHHRPHAIGEHGRVVAPRYVPYEMPRNEICVVARARRGWRPCRVRCSRWNRSATCRRTSPCSRRRSRSRTRPSALVPPACRVCRRRRGARLGTRRTRSACRPNDRRLAGSKPMRSSDREPEARCVRRAAERDVLEARSTGAAGVEQHRARRVFGRRDPDQGQVDGRRRSGCRSRVAPAASRTPAWGPGHSDRRTVPSRACHC